jgi:hypothetical protein
MRIKHWYFGLVLLVVLAACSPAVTQGDPTEQVVSTKTEAVMPSSTPEAALNATKTPVDEDTGDLSTTGLQSECTLVSSLPDPSQENAEIFAARPDDWVLGPEDAAITLVEYGDFQ